MTPPLPVDTSAATRALAKADPVLAAVMKRVGPCIIAPKKRVDVFQALLRAIVYQQLHGRAAGAIHARVLKVIGTKRDAARTLATVPDEPLRAAGLSAAKLAAIRDLAAKTLDGTVPTQAQAAKLTDDELIARLTAVRGIGPWTAHMLMLFHLGRPDILPTGDYAIRKAFSLLYRRGREASIEALVRHARRWRPHRSTASWYLWRSLDVATPD
jgi:3-methyladenine DNA glycosylase/8-oxoguanine DNA glycosylase